MFKATIKTVERRKEASNFLEIKQTSRINNSRVLKI